MSHVLPLRLYEPSSNEEIFIIFCPKQDRDHAWWKACQQTIALDGPEHSWDASSQLDHVMKEQGWRAILPNCKTPIQKDTAYDHMMYISPGFNSNLIVQPIAKAKLETAVSAHYNRRQFFDEPD
ncbi:hypothetical protein PAXINDRAFT_102408 [Paxillus involutus ATCC 200175]|uniref:Uncharacterized protein n=1 Tax=Paxillus involutus ATCC 200175 TaxID=664439 RepID=A0A0C9TNX1_PAXIN|nr:hypothetical protein PAXINDRAFT_102408 [Paxillus involutus ATCC 200175]